MAGEICAEPDETRLVTIDLLSRLPHAQAMVIQLRVLEGYSVDEVSRMLSRSPASVKNLQYRGMQSLRQMLAKEGAL